ncbi:MAG: sel1 repeat family protein, partial [Verrucomicrobia bacterium]|nr:sel1 repeat family protein [Verrucomicrobiota bacterium]
MKSLGALLCAAVVLCMTQAVVGGQEKADAEKMAELRRNAERGDAAAQFILALAYEKGLVGVTKDAAEAVKWYRKAAELGFPGAQLAVGTKYVLGEGVPKDEVEGYKWILLAAEGRDENAQQAIAIIESRLTPAQRAEGQQLAHKFQLRKAEQGDATAQFNLGVSYDFGRGVVKDEAEAVKWYRKAADQGHAAAQFNLGLSYAEGQGVVKDEAEAVKWYRKAADQGHASAQFNLGVMYDNGRGVVKDEAEAVKWYRKAADQGYAQAQYNLGLSYANGEGVVKDEAE